MTDIVDRLDVVGSYPEEREAKAEILKLRADIERLRTTLGYLADNIDNPALVAVAENALRRKP